MASNDTPIYDNVQGVKGCPGPQDIPSDIPDDKVSFIKGARKSIIAALAGAATAITATVPPQIGDGVFTPAEFWFTFTITVGSAIVAGFAVWRVPNAQ